LAQASAALCAPPAIVITGTDSKIDKPMSCLIDCQQSLVNMLAEHTGRTVEQVQYGKELISIDFDKYILVALFHGVSHNNTGISVVDVLDKDDEITIRFRPNWYRSIGGINDTKSFAFILIPKANKPVAVEENVSKGSDAPTWKKHETLQRGKK
jgi:hypothetical protein